MAAKKILRQILSLVLLAVIPAAIAVVLHPKRPVWNREALAPGEVLLATAQEWDGKVLWLDARTEANFQKEHIPGAMLLNEDDWNDLFPRVMDAWNKEKIIVVYCDSLQCQASKEVAERLRNEAHLPQVYVLKGGWQAWLDSKK